MKRIILGVIGIVTVLAVKAQDIQPWQLQTNDTARHILIVDSLLENGEYYKEAVWKSMDSLVKQIAIDSLGLDTALWKSDGYNALVQKKNEANIGIGTTALLNSASGANNVAIGNEALKNLTSTTGNVAVGFGAARSNTGSTAVSIGQNAMRDGSCTNCVAVGNSAAQKMTGSGNIAIGFLASHESTTAIRNVVIGEQAGRYSTGSDNVYMGWQAGRGLDGGVYSSRQNVGVGRSALYKAAAGNSNNTAVGYAAGFNTTTGTKNTYSGAFSGYANATGSLNVLLGFQSGYYETSSNKLYIENSTSSTPLIYGEFDTDLVRVNGAFEVTDKAGTGTNVASFDGNKLVDSGIGISSLVNDDTNELQTLSQSGQTVTLSDGGGAFDLPLDTDTQLTETEVDNFVANNGYLTSETDEFGGMDFYSGGGSTYFYRAEDDNGNALGDPLGLTAGSNVTFTPAGNGLIINATGSTSPWADAGSFLSSQGADIVVDNIDLTSAGNGTNAVRLIGQDNSGWLTDVPVFGASIQSGTLVMSDVSASNELQTLSVSGNSLTISSGNTVTLPGVPSRYNSFNPTDQTLGASETTLNLGTTTSLGFSNGSAFTNPTTNDYYFVSATVNFEASTSSTMTCQIKDGSTVIAQARTQTGTHTINGGSLHMSGIDFISGNISLSCSGPTGSTIDRNQLTAHQMN